MMTASPELIERLEGLTRQLSEVLSNLELPRQKQDWARERSDRLFNFSGNADIGSRDLVRSTRPPLPDPRLVRRIIKQRRLRAQFFNESLFADPAWDMLLDLTIAHAEHSRVSVTSLCIASGVPSTTALRWIGQMVEAGLLKRVEDDQDRRRAFVALSDSTAHAMARYFEALGVHAHRAI